MTLEHEKDRYPHGKGFCGCGCGTKTKIAPHTRNDCGWIKGEPLRYIHGHNQAPGNYIATALSNRVEREVYPFGKGKCSCGCGGNTEIAKSSNSKQGSVKGEPLRWIKGHNNKKWPELPEPPQGYKRCSRCVKVKPNSEFYPLRINKDGLHAYCKKCQIKMARDYQAKNLDSLRRNRRKENLKRFGLSSEAYDELLSSQNGVCAICKGHEPRHRSDGTRKPLCVDHSHATGKVRGLLCSKCNTAIGLLQDDAQIVANAAAYLIDHSPPVAASKSE